MEDEAPVLIQSVKVQQKCIVHRFRLKNLGDIGLPAWRNRKESEMVDPFILPLNQKAKGIGTSPECQEKFCAAPGGLSGAPAV